MGDSPQNEPTHDPLIGVRLGGYVIEKALGRGSMGTVYRARQVALDRPVALKAMSASLAARGDLVARFLREAKAAAAINHPNLVQVHDFGQAGGTYFYAMELVDGLSLGEYLRRGDRFSELECIEIGREVTLALQAAHEAGVIHRDVKPDNLLLTGKGVIKLADLGLAHMHEIDTDVALTMPGTSVGTPLYMSPEQARGDKAIDQRTDFYSLGATLFHLATAQVPYDGATAGAILSKQLTEPVPSPRMRNPTLSQPFSDLIRRLMGKSVRERPATHEEILEALENCHAVVRQRDKASSRITAGASLAEAAAAAAAPHAAEVYVRPERTWPIWVACGSIFLVVALAGYLATRPEPEPETVVAEEVPPGAPVSPAGPDEKARGVEGKAVAGRHGEHRAKSAKGEMRVHEPAEGASGEMTKPRREPKDEVRPVAQPGKPIASAEELASASREKPFVNSLGMKFVPVPGTRILMSVHEARVKDFQAFAVATGRRWQWKAPFDQGASEPMTQISWVDAKAFCAWLEMKEGLEYRLPTDEEWDAAVGKGKYSWGSEWPPPGDSENLAGEEAILGDGSDPRGGAIPGWRDEHPRTAPVGSYAANALGLHDMGGNVREWVEDWFTDGILKRHKEGGAPDEGFSEALLGAIHKGDALRVIRGAGWHIASGVICATAYRSMAEPGDRDVGLGFRCALVAPSVFSVAEATPPVPAPGGEGATAPAMGAVSNVAPAAVGPSTNMAEAVRQAPPDSLTPEEEAEIEALLAPLREAHTTGKQATDERSRKYVAELEELEKKVAARGDLDGALAIRKEREAWAAGQPTPKPDSSVRMPSEYNNLRYFVDRDLGFIATRTETAVKRELGRAVPALRLIELRLTRSARLEAALKVRELAGKLEKGEVPGVEVGTVAPPKPGSVSPILAAALTSATRDKPFENSLGMRFVPVKGTGVLFSVWETRVKDFEAFVKEAGYPWTGVAPFEQAPDHPVVMVNWDDAAAFCAWLSKKEGVGYRLPTDAEWDAAVGKEKFPWGEDSPPSDGVENLAGDELQAANGKEPKLKRRGYEDEHPHTAPVGTYKANRYGLYDMGGNVREWVQDWINEEIYRLHLAGGGYPLPEGEQGALAAVRAGNVARVVRGGAWRLPSLYAVSSGRGGFVPGERLDYVGFRCVLALPSP